MKEPYSAVLKQKPPLPILSQKKQILSQSFQVYPINPQVVELA
jgi:hypothetical protein